MEAIVLPLTYFGNLSYFKYLYTSEEVWIDDTEVYLKQTFRNRMQIIAANGVLDLSVPVQSTKGLDLTIDKIKISYDDRWQLKHWRTIQSAYKSSPFFEEYEHDIKALINMEHDLLIDLNKSILSKLIKLLGHPKKVKFASDGGISSKAHSLRGYFKPSKIPDSNFKPYLQVFNYKHGFSPNLSILDLLFNEGPYSVGYLLND